MEIIALAVGILIGIFTGMVWRGTYLKSNAIGNLRIDHSDPEETYMFLELKTDPRMVEKENFVVLKVKVENFVSQK